MTKKGAKIQNMKTINTNEIYKAIKQLALRCNCNVNKDVICSLQQAEQNEQNQSAKFALNTILQNNEIASQHNMPACQDTGMAVVFCEIGQEVKLEGEFLNDAINRGIKEAYAEGYFRKSVLDPLSRQNTQDNLPAVIHTQITKGDKVKIHFLAKGFGSENMSRLFMLTPSQGVDGIVNAVLQTVKDADSNPCPPIIVGVGIGGTFEKCALLAKKCLLREVGSTNPDDTLNQLENELKDKINSLGIGVQGFGGNNTCLAVFADKYPTHIAGLPVAINIQCHCARHGTIEL